MVMLVNWLGILDGCLFDNTTFGGQKKQATAAKYGSIVTLLHYLGTTCHG